MAGQSGVFGQLQALRALCGLLLQLGLHAVESVDRGQLEGQRLLAIQAQDQQRKAVAGEAVGGGDGLGSISAFDLSRRLRKITDLLFA